MKKIIQNPRFFIPLLIAIGVVYRALLVAVFPQPFVADQTQYHDIALGILNNGIFANANRTYGYPMLVALWYAIFGVGNVWAWTLIQVCMDALIAVFIYWTTKDVFGKKLPAVIAFVFYIVSPFVAAYAGMLLTEVSAVFCMALFLLCWGRFFQTKKILYLIFAAFLMGFIPEIRPAFFYFMVVLFVILLFMMWRMKVKLWQGMLVVIFFFLPISYAYLGNYLLFHRVSPLVADDGGLAHELVASQHLEGRAPHPIDKPGGWPDRIGQLGWGLRFPYEREYRENLKREHYKEGIDLIKKDPWRFVKVRFAKAWYIWEKHYLFIFTQEPRIIEHVANLLNTFLLATAISGIFIFGRQRLQNYQRIFLWTCISLILYTSGIHMISSAEQRYSLPAYPILFIFSGYAVSIVLHHIRKKTSLRQSSKE